jgi:hypothetical protein
VLVARAEDDQLAFERREAILARIRARYDAIPADVSLVDEFIEASG